MTPIAAECGEDGTFCPLGAHAVTGWCLVSTGDPVLVVTTITCPPGDVESGISVSLIDPITGDPVTAQDIVPCGGQSWGVNQLCDYDVDGELIATFLQIFEFNEITGALEVTLVRADDPMITYVPTGEVRACSIDIEIEFTPFCYDDGSFQRGWQAWIFTGEVHTGSLYFQDDGTPIIAPNIIDCPEPATEDTLAEILAELVTPTVVERRLDGDDITGAGSIVIPDGVLSFGVTVRLAGAGVTIDGPDFAAPVSMFGGQSISHSGDDSNTLNGPITITTTAGSEVNATWVLP